MKTNKKVWKIVSVILALAMVVTLMPSGLFSGTTEVKAATSLFTDYSDFTASMAYYYESVDSTVPNYTDKSTTYGIKNAWNNSSSVGVWGHCWSSGQWIYYYQTLSTAEAGTYTLSAYVKELCDVWTSGTTVTVYPYVNSAYVSAASNSLTCSNYTTGSSTAGDASGSSDDAFSYEFTLDEDTTNYVVGIAIYITGTGQFGIDNISLSFTSSDSSSSGSTSSGTISWADGNVPGTFESGTLNSAGSTMYYPTGTGMFASYVYVNSSTYVGNGITINEDSNIAHGGSKYAAIYSSSGRKFFSIEASESATTRLTPFDESNEVTFSGFLTEVSWTEYTLTFTPTSSTYYINIGAQYTGNDYTQYLIAQLTDLDTDTEYTCTFYYCPYYDGSYYWTLIDDITITYGTAGETITIGDPSVDDSYEEYALGTDYDSAAGDTMESNWTVVNGSLTAADYNWAGYTYWGATWGAETSYVYYTGNTYNLTAGTYMVEAYFEGTTYSTVYPALFDTDGNRLTDYDFSDSAQFDSIASSGWGTSAVEWEFELTEDVEECYVGFYYVASDTSKDWINFTNPVWKYQTDSDTAELITVGDPDEGYEEYALGTSYTDMTGVDFASGWKYTGGSTAKDSSYGWSGYTYWTDVYDANTYYAYYSKQPLNIKAGTYKVAAYYAAYTATSAYPAIFDSTGAILYSYSGSNDSDSYATSWTTDAFTWTIEVDKDITEECYVGFVYEGTSSADWANITNVVWKYYTSSDDVLLYGEDNLYNTGFESGGTTGWYGTDGTGGAIEVDGADSSYNGYLVKTDSDTTNGTYVFSAWNNSGASSDYTITMSGYALLSSGTWYLNYKTIGVNTTGNSSVYLTVESTDEVTDENGDAIGTGGSISQNDGSTYYAPFSGSWATCTEYVGVAEDETADEWSSEFEYDDSNAIIVDDGEAVMVKVTVYITLSATDYISLDDIQFIDETYTGTVNDTEYLAYNNFENGGFEDAWVINQYWTATLDGSTISSYEDTDYYSHAVAIKDKSEYEGGSYSGDDLIVAGYSNYSEDAGDSDGVGATHTVTLSQRICMEETGTYYISADSMSWVCVGDDSTAGIKLTVVTQEKNSDGEYETTGTLLSDQDICNGIASSWTTMQTGTFYIGEEDTIILVTVTIVMGSYYNSSSDYANSSFALDDFAIHQYVVNEYEGDGTFQAVYNSEGSSYVNGANYVKGVDISSIISLEAAGTKYNGGQDIFQILKDAGVNSIRIRVWVAPSDSNGIYGGGMNDSAVAVMIAQRAADVGLSVMLSFHLSDFWADPSHQVKPASWGSTASSAASSAYTHVYETVEDVLATGVDLQFVTIGNETTGSAGVSGFTGYSNMATILTKAATAVDDAVSASGLNTNSVMVGLHTAAASTFTYGFQMFSSLNAQIDGGLDEYFDFLATSFYPYWSSYSDSSSGSGSAYDALYTTLLNNLKSAVDSYGLPVMIAEFKWPYSITEDQDGSSTGTDKGDVSNYYWDISVDGQGDFIEELNYTVASAFSASASSNYKGMFIGTYYWEPAWIAAGNSSGWSSSSLALWKNYGCGVATYAGAYYAWGSSTANSSPYSTDGAAGSATDELALFTANGYQTDALNCLNYKSDTMPITRTYSQVSNSATGSSGSTDTYSVRFVGMIVMADEDVSGETYDDSTTRSYFDSVGFKLEYTLDSDNDGEYNNINNLKVKTLSKLYKSISANGTTLDADTYYTETLGGSLDEDEHCYFYTYIVSGVPYTDSGTYYFKLISTAKGTYNYQQETSYYSLSFGSSTPTLTYLDAWDYTGSNDNLTSENMTSYELYPTNMQN